MTERLYALVRIREGDYVCPSNDRAWLWRFRAYDEDGSASKLGADDRWRPVLGRRWQALRVRTPTVAEFDRIDDIDDLAWESWSHGHRTRADAIGEMMRVSEPAS